MNPPTIIRSKFGEAMKFVIATLLGLALSIADVFGQNFADWSRQYDYNQTHDCFNDIYATSDGGYVTCGLADQQVWITKLDGNGGVEWSQTYGDAVLNYYDGVWTVIETDNGSFLVGMSRNNNFSALLVSGQGDEIWWNDYGEGFCHALIELKDSNFILVGHAEGRNNRAGKLVQVDAQGRVVWTELYDPGYCDLYSLRESDGGIVVTGSVGVNVAWMMVMKTCLVKFSYRGEVLWERVFAPQNSSIGRGVVSAQDGGYAVTGYCSFNENIFNFGQIYLLKTNHQGELSWIHTLPKETNNSAEGGWSLMAPESGGYAIVGITNNPASRVCRLKMVRTTDLGLQTWKRLLGEGQGLDDESRKLMFYSVIRGHDNSIVAAGNNNGPGEGMNGFIIKLVPRGLERMRITYEPLDTTLVIFQGTHQRFTVHVQGEPTGLVSYLWTYDGADISGDSTVSIFFDELGEHDVSCFVADEVSTAMVSWKILVDEFFIVESTPDVDHIQVHRGTTKGFSIDSVATVYLHDELDYYWTLQRTDGEMLAEYPGRDSIDIDFNRVGYYSVTGMAGIQGVSDTVTYLVDVEGLIWSTEPGSYQISVPPDTSVDFRIIPLISEPNNVFSWYMDGQLVAGGDDSIYTAYFSEIRRHHLQGILTDGYDIDSVAWDISVRLRTSVDDLEDGLPPNSTFLQASPNPFNSTVRISFAVINRGKQTLTIHDITGREVANFNGKLKMEHGTGEVVWDATAFPAGIYFARLEAGSDIQTVKMVLVR